MKRRTFFGWLGMLGPSGIFPATAQSHEFAARNTFTNKGSGKPAQLATGRSLQLDRVAEIRYASAPTSIAWHPDSRRIAAAIDFGRRIAISDAVSGGVLAELSRSQALGPRTVAFTPDGKHLVSTAADPNRHGPWALGVWDVTTGSLVLQIPRPRAPDLLIDDIVIEVHVSGDGRYALACGRKGRKESLVVFDATSWEFLRALDVREGILQHPCALSFDGRVAAQCARRGDRFAPTDIVIFDLGSGAQLVQFAAHRPYIEAIAWSRDGRRLLSGAGGLVTTTDPRSGKAVAIRDEDPVRIWDATAGTLVRSFRGEFDPVGVVDWHRDDRLMVVDGTRGRGIRGSMLTFWDTAAGDLRLRYERSGDAYLSRVQFSPDGQLIAIAQDNVITIDRVVGI